MVSSEMDALLNASPFAEPYPISESSLEAAGGGPGWTDELDHVLTLFTRKYAFDFEKCSKALRVYAASVILGIDGGSLPPNETLAPEGCRCVLPVLPGLPSDFAVRPKASFVLASSPYRPHFSLFHHLLQA